MIFNFVLWFRLCSKMELILILSFLSAGLAYDKASFYGASFISYPLQEAKGITDISFRFRTHLSDALLLLAAGKTDYCMIRLESGRLKLHINLGAGESELSSVKGLFLNDSQWHHVSIIRREANLTMKVDDSAVKKKLPGRFFELNIHFGIFLGGQGDFSELFLGHMENFRGCMEDVYYNSVKILEKARSRSGSVHVEGVTWNCAPEFDADLNSDISFVDEGAYLILPKINSRAGGRWHMEFKTITQNAIILYNTGGGRGSDFLAVEILEGVVRVKMARGQIVHTLRVSDGQWHKMHLSFNPSLIELSVDNVAMSTRIESGGTRYLDLSDSFYLGGIESEKRQRAFAKGIKAADSSIMGCIKPVEVDEKMYGLPNAVVTYGVSPKCVWWYPCHSSPGSPPCVPRAVCEQHGVDHFTCKCDSDLCINPDYAEKYKVFSRSSSELELVALYPLTVQEGGVAVITTQNIDVILDHHKYGVRPSGVVLHVASPPQHGRIAVELSLQRSHTNYAETEGKPRQLFTLLDLTRDKIDSGSMCPVTEHPLLEVHSINSHIYEEIAEEPRVENEGHPYTARVQLQAAVKVRYVHDGSENHQDAIVLDMELVPESKFTLPSYLQGRNTFVLHVNVTPVNDPPVLALALGKALRLTQGTRKVITSDILKAEDPDTPPEDLLYTVLHGKNEANSGHIEMSGQPVDSFTQQDVDSGVVSYVHGAAGDKQLNKTSLRLTLQVSDGIETSGPGILRISVVPLQVRLVNNTGLQLVHNAYALITADNLTFATNADETNVHVKYDIVKPPQFGVVERLRVLDGTWQTVDSFTSEMVNFGRVRYMHLLGSPTHDEFKFKASVGTIRTNTLYDFRLTFIKLELYQSTNEELVLNNTREAFISSQHLRFRTKPLALPSDRVLYTILRAPKYGILHLSSGKHHLQMHSTFTQHHIDTDQLWYRLHRRAYSHIQDEFSFIVGATECENITGVMTIRHVPGSITSDHSSGRVHTTLERLQVMEGSRMVIPATHLNFRTDSVTNLVFNITHIPKHGKIEVINENLKIARDNTTYFTLHELNSDRVYYAHDDSESRHDSFHFMALSPEPEDFQYVGVFHIDIILKNDNSPVRANDNVFHIVHGGARLITARDLSYTDADLDTKPSDIIYTVQRFTKDPPNGGIFRADNPAEQIAQFSQDDINKNLVLFKHQGKEYGKMAFWISDGLFDVNGNLEIQASPPFIRMFPTNGSIVENGKAVVISAKDMQVDTNMNCLEEDIRYEVTLEPKHGSIEVGEGQGAYTFTQLDVAAGRVAYRHREPKTPSDQFRFKVMCLETWGEGSYPIRIFPSSYWEPLRVSAGRPLIVEESTSVNITKDVLEVMHPQIEPSNIVYKVTEGPYHGWLEISTTPGAVELENYEEPVHTRVFDQSIINANRLVYVQSGVNRTRDRIKMDVTNGIVWLRDIELNVIIIPEHFYVLASNLTVVEGDTVSVKPDLFRTVTEYYRGKVVSYKVLDKPRYGKIVVGDQELSLLPVLKLNSGNIQYVNDGSEESSDAFKLVAITESGKESEPFHVRINIVPVNDETPIVAANTGLCVWEGGTFTFTRNELYVNDIDTPLENVTISVVDIVSGYIALQGDPETAISRFTQADIDNGRVIFVHKNGTKGKMIFNVTDGLHELSKITFLISTKSVSLKLVRKNKLRVFPLMREPLNNYFLMSKCSDLTRTIVYKIDRAPTLGRLIMLNGDNHHRTIKQFTQQDVNDSKVYYEHTHPFSDLYTNDSFIFTVEAALAKPITDQMFNIDISVSSGGLAKYVYVPQINVQEGDKVPIRVNVTNVIAYLETQAGLRQPQVEAQWSTPSYGELKPSMSSLTQSQLEGGVVNYEHDDSDTLQDKIDMSLYLLPDYVLLCNVTIPINIIPVNDQPFRLLTDSPQIQVVQGENYTITKNDLLTEDADTGPSGILYDIISGPTQGRIVMLDKNQTIDEALSINKFTQEDINSRRIIYEHSGMLQTATFYFRVWDGQFKPTYTVFTIDVLPVILNATSMHPISLQQGSNVATVTTQQIYVETNAKKTKVWYNITRQPQHGMIYVGRSPVTYFSHKDLIDKVVIYMQNDMTTANDSFDLVAYVHNSNSTRPFTIEVIVQPLMKLLGDLKVEAEKAKITLNVMDASGLAKLTASDPVYTILRKPRHGVIKKIIRSSGEKTSAREREVAYFTHEDIKAGVIYYVTKKKLNDLNGIEDNFRFLLAATIFQPAAGEVKVFIGNRPKKNLPGPNDPESHEGVLVSNGETASYYMMILVALSGTVLAIVVIFGLLKCRRYLMRDQNALVKIHGQSQGAVAPIPLPRPPDHLMPSPSTGTPPIKRYVSSEQSVHTGASTPLPSSGSVACKVTPLADAALDLNTRYPYGTEDHTDAEDWSSYEASESAFPVRGGAAPANPMLRRNQYWV